MAEPKNPVRNLDRRMLSFVDPLGRLLADSFHILALFAIGGATVWAAAVAFRAMVEKGSASIEDLLLLFIYLEIGSMVGIYFRTEPYAGAIPALRRHHCSDASPDCFRPA